MTDGPPRVALVTGAAGGLGAAIAEHLLAEGYRVIGFDRRAISTSIERLTGVRGDATSEADVRALADRVAEQGPLHVLVNAVGSVCVGRFEDLTLEQWRAGLDANLTSVFLVTRAVLPVLSRATGDRAIVNVSSTLARVSDPETIAYGAAKAALEQLGRTLALDLAPRQIRVNTVAPGPVAETTAEARWDEAQYGALNPSGRFARPAEVARVVAFLASDASAYITGGVYAVDGGDAALGVGWGPLRRLAGGA